MADARRIAPAARRERHASGRACPLTGPSGACRRRGLASRSPETAMRIVCATDLVSGNLAAIERAGLLADQLKADLSLLHVVVPGESQQALEEALQSAYFDMQ